MDFRDLAKVPHKHFYSKHLVISGAGLAYGFARIRSVPLEAKWSSGSPTLATSGGIFLEGDQGGVWEGRLALATLQDSKLRLFEFTPEGAFVSQVVVPELNGAFGRLRTPMMGPDGALYVTTSNGGGVDRILRIVKDEAVPVTLKLTRRRRSVRTAASAR